MNTNLKNEKVKETLNKMCGKTITRIIKYEGYTGEIHLVCSTKNKKARAVCTKGRVIQERHF